VSDQAKRTSELRTSELVIDGLRAGVDGREILHGIDLAVRSGEVHAVMGPNGSGKSTLSHVLLGRPGYTVMSGRVTLDGVDLLSLPTWERAQAGLFLGMQYPIEVPGVTLEDVLGEAAAAGGRDRAEVPELVRAEAARVGFDERFLARPLNVDLSGGERKRNETVQLGVLRPKFAVLDEIDSGLDVDALWAVARRVEAATTEIGLGVVAITHYTRLLRELRPDRTHVLSRGRIVAAGGPELADELEETGYAAWADEEAETRAASSGVSSRPEIADPFGGPGDPFADPLA
jgi:Fe-S cluster assembly ATP-binding protein